MSQASLKFGMDSKTGESSDPNKAQYKEKQKHKNKQQTKSKNKSKKDINAESSYLTLEKSKTMQTNSKVKTNTKSQKSSNSNYVEADSARTDFGIPSISDYVIETSETGNPGSDEDEDPTITSSDELTMEFDDKSTASSLQFLPSFMNTISGASKTYNSKKAADKNKNKSDKKTNK